jgi:hypothetical protein
MRQGDPGPGPENYFFLIPFCVFVLTADHVVLLTASIENENSSHLEFVIGPTMCEVQECRLSVVNLPFRWTTINLLIRSIPN